VVNETAMNFVLAGKNAALALRRKVLPMSNGAIMYICVPIKGAYKGSGGITGMDVGRGSRFLEIRSIILRLKAWSKIDGSA
jgi:hypothetical protein